MNRKHEQDAGRIEGLRQVLDAVDAAMSRLVDANRVSARSENAYDNGVEEILCKSIIMLDDFKAAMIRHVRPWEIKLKPPRVRMARRSPLRIVRRS